LVFVGMCWYGSPRFYGKTLGRGKNTFFFDVKL